MAYINHQKIWAFLAGVGLVGAAYVSTRTLIWQRAATVADAWPGSPPPPEPLPEAQPLISRETKEYAARRWNQGVDNMFRPTIKYLSERGF
ncbi:hypothetical protein WJX75_004189 [Coccomyxa subellipsoidea]|uniref:Uncharacterized protein n=1 Tax=Coccomyxa subellipsoidea TaxID=248742 RepID=A0ABR2YPR7_9CHLO